MRLFFRTTFLLVLCANTLFAQQTAKRTDSGVGYLEHLPPDYYANPGKKYPLLIFLHGLGERGDGSPGSLENVKKNGPPREIERGHNMCFTVDGVEECFIVISPQLSSSVNTWFADITNDIVDFVYANYRFDPDRVYLTGLSLGGGGTYRYSGSSFNQPNELAAIAPIAGWGYGADACIIAEGNISVWAFHGDQDTTIPYNWGVDIYNSIQNCSPPTSGDLKFTTYEGVGHNSWWMTYLTDNSWHTPNLYEWLLRQRRTTGGIPTANAGPDKNIQLPTNLISLQGSGTDSDGTIVAYNWRKISGPSATLTNVNSSELTASNLVGGTYIFELSVTDNDGNTATDQVQIIVQAAPANLAPMSNAGADRSLTLPQNSTTINGTGSDNDGSIVTWTWTQISGPSTAAVSGNTTANLQVADLIEGIYTFRLTVIDDDGASGFDEMNLTVNPSAANAPPVAYAGSDQLLTLPVNATNLVGSGSDADGTITTYQWTQVSGPSSSTITNVNTPVASVSNLLQGIYVFSLQVTDDENASDSDEVIVTVQQGNISPTANAGSDISLVLPTNSTVITGSATDPDGTLIGYTWQQVGGPSTATLSNASTATVTVAGLIEGTYNFELEVEDNDGATDTDQVMVVVQPSTSNQLPVATAGPDQTIYLPQNSVSLTGSGTDANGVIVSFNWTKTSGPASFIIQSPDNASTQIDDLVPGIYVFTLSVTDDDGEIATDNVSIIVVDASTNAAPLVNAGPDRQVTLPTSSINVTGSATDSDGTISTLEWTQQSGPSTASITNGQSVTVTFSGLQEGIYVFVLSATDDDDAITIDQMTLTVNAANVPPIVNAGQDINIQLPENTVAINGTASDPDGALSTIVWSQVSGPSSAVLSGETTLNVTISALVEGEYVFRLTVTDENGSNASDNVRIIVSGANALPIVNAGTDRTITLPTNTINLNGNATDTDGTISLYSWTQVSGPSTALLVNSSTQTLTAEALVEGVYIFQLAATDNDGGEGTDEIQVTVNSAALNQSPTANAGPDKQLTLPVNSTNITGTGSDPDGTIANYAWVKISGGTATITNTSNPTLSISGLAEGVYIFEFTVTDDDGATDTDRMTITVSAPLVNQVPTANAGSDKTIILPVNTLTLQGSGVDPDGTVLTYNWAKSSGGNANLLGATTPTLNLSSLEEGAYVFTLTVTDEDGASDSDEVSVIVEPEDTNDVPVVNAGTNQTLKLPTNATSLTGSASDTDGSIISYQWRKTSGPTGGTLTNANQAKASVSGLNEGFYTFSLTATDNDGDIGSDRMSITVLSESSNAAPVADAGNNITLKLPANQITVYGKGTDTDGAIVNYEWSKVAGPSSFSMNTPNRSSVTISGLTEGVYIVRLTVFDDEGAQGSDELTITVTSSAANALPYVNAGPDKVIYLPNDQVNLTGTAIDSDGAIVGITWVKVSGGSATITNDSGLFPTISSLQEGAYTFRLTVTDDQNASSSDDVMIFVQPSTVNQPPFVDAGSSLNLVLPANSGSLTAIANDEDGVITSVNWQSLDQVPPVMSGANTLELLISDLTEGVYSFQVTVTDDDGLEASDITYVTISQKEMIPPIISIMDDQTLESSQTTLELWAEAADDGRVVSVFWDQVLGPPVAIENPQETRTNTTGWQPGTYEFRFTAIDDDGLSSTSSVIIYVVDENTIESAFPMKIITPNGDYDNERWILDPDMTRHASCRLLIYDRNGYEVFNVVGYNNDWNAVHNAKELPEGVYYYFLKCEEEGNNAVTGSITVIR